MTNSMEMTDSRGWAGIGHAFIVGVLMACAQTAAATERTTRAVEEALEEITIVGSAEEAQSIAGSAQLITAEELERFAYTDIQSTIRQIPGVTVQLEDGYGLRPNLSMRGTASDRSSRITLLEDNVLIAPAPYSAPAAYYFPTLGRMSGVEVLKGPAAIRQGPYTVGGAINFLSTPIPADLAAQALVDVAEHDTSRVHAFYGDSSEHFGWLAETHLWQSAGYQHIDFAGGDTGLDKDDWMLKLRAQTGPDADVHHQLDLKLQLAREQSEQSYLGLTDADLAEDPYRRYAVSQLDNIDTDHDQAILRYLAVFESGLSFTATAYANDHQRDWFKTEALDGDGSASAADFSGTSWFKVVQAVNRGEALGTLTARELQAVLDGADTPAGSVQVRSNAREYHSRGVQLGMGLDLELGRTRHEIELGLRVHEDEEDRLQQYGTYHLEGGRMVLDDAGVPGNADNSVQSADAVAFHVYDRIELGPWVITPGVRHERMEQRRVRWETRAGLTEDPASRADANLRDTRENETDVWIPGIGLLYAFGDGLSVFGGVHRGFTAPGSDPEVRQEESINYEAGVRLARGALYTDVTAFFTDYDNLLGLCTASSGGDCEIGEAFNGDAATIPGLEVMLRYDFAPAAGVLLPFTLSYTYSDAEFDSDIADTEFFGSVSTGDPIPYIPDNELFLSFGMEWQRWRTYLNASYVDSVCVVAACGPFEETDSALFLDLVARVSLSDRVELYGRADNLSAEDAIMGRHPYGARANKDRTLGLGVRFRL